MARKHTGGDEGGAGGHGDDRPWVYFMIDSFFLCTQFFVVTFKVKSDEAVLPQKLPPGIYRTENPAPPAVVRPLAVHVSNVNGQAVYLFHTREVALAGFTEMLARSTGAGMEYQVRVSYEPDVPFKDVMAVFNACAKMQISKCGLIPLRGSDAVN